MDAPIAGKLVSAIRGSVVTTQALEQFRELAKVYVEPFEPDDVSSVDSATRARVENWYREFKNDLSCSKNGYVQEPAFLRETPDLEDRFLEVAKKAFGSKVSLRNSARPTICLSHDIDYLETTLQMRMKQSVNQRSFSPLKLREQYLESIQEILEFDASLRPKEEGSPSTVFVALPRQSLLPHRRAIQWLIDPSYRVGSESFDRLKELLRQHRPQLGIHGSFYSIQAETLADERSSLSRALNLPVTAGRQHWLNIPNQQSTGFVQKILDSGVEIDSTMGWNGGTGFRGGMARPYPILAPAGQVLWEIPMVLMDGVLFFDLRLDPDQAFDHSIRRLKEVKKRNGCVSINWHGRSAHRQYQWFDVYRRIVDWAQSEGFEFKTMAEAVEINGK